MAKSLSTNIDTNTAMSVTSMSTTPPAPIDVSEITTASLSLLDKLRAITSISTQSEYNFIVSVGREAQRYLKLANEKLDPNISRWKAGLDAAKSEKDDIIAPFKEAKTLAKSLGEDWIKREKARKLEEDRALLERISSDSRNQLREEVEQNIAVGMSLTMPTAAMPLFPSSATVKAPGSSVRTYPKFRILDSSLVHRDYCKPDEQLIRQLFNSLEDPREIETLVGSPGAVEYYEDDNLSFRAV